MLTIAPKPCNSISLSFVSCAGTCIRCKCALFMQAMVCLCAEANVLQQHSTFLTNRVASRVENSQVAELCANTLPNVFELPLGRQDFCLMAVLFKFHLAACPKSHFAQAKESSSWSHSSKRAEVCLEAVPSKT